MLGGERDARFDTRARFRVPYRHWLFSFYVRPGVVHSDTRLSVIRILIYRWRKNEGRMQGQRIHRLDHSIHGPRPRSSDKPLRPRSRDNREQQGKASYLTKVVGSQSPRKPAHEKLQRVILLHGQAKDGLGGGLVIA